MKYGCMDEWMDGWIYGWMDERMYGWMGGWTVDGYGGGYVGLQDTLLKSGEFLKSLYGVFFSQRGKKYIGKMVWS